MAAPEYVPTSPTQTVRSYSAPDVVPEAWTGDRGASLGGHQPSGEMYGFQGPDQGYALVIARRLRDKVVVTAGESVDDVLAGAVQVGLKRASLFGRAPVVHDLVIGLTLWGYMSDAPDDLVELRKPLFEGLANAHHWVEMREMVDIVPAATLRRSRSEIEAEHALGWRALLGQ